MAAYLATAVLWISAATRVYATIRRPDPGRVSLTIGALCVALALSVLATASVFDAQLDWPNRAEIVQHLLFAAATYATLLFLLFLRRNALPRRELIMQSTLALSVGFSMIALFAVAPVLEQSSTNFAVDYGDSVAALLYRAIFDSYLVYGLVGIAWMCLRHAFTSADGPRSASLFFVASGSAFAAVAAFAVGAGEAAAVRHRDPAAVPWIREHGDHRPGREPRGHRHSGSDPGGGSPAVATSPPHLRSPQRALGGAHQSRSGCCSTDAVDAVPAGAGRADIDPRRRIEIADALSRIRVDERDAAVIQRSDDPPAALGQALRDASRWASSGGSE